MDAFVDILIQHGYWGMFVAAFLAASVFPFSSEAVMVGLQVAGLLLLWGLAFLFVWFTYRTPHIALFQDPLTGSFGLG